MHSNTSTSLRVAALLGAGSITASILLGLALLAKPVMQVGDPSAGQELTATAAPVDVGAPERLHLTVVGTRDVATPERLRITVVGSRDQRTAPAPTLVRAQADCPPDTAHSRYTGSAASPATRPSKV